MADANEYIPGVCNIGKAEITRRKVIGWVALLLTLVLWAALVVFQAPAAWRLVLFFPTMVAMIGFLQAAWHFCAKFGLNGVFNFGANVGLTDTVAQAEYRRRDRRTALQIIGLSLLAGAMVAAVAYYLSP